MHVACKLAMVHKYRYQIQSLPTAHQLEDRLRRAQVLLSALGGRLAGMHVVPSLVHVL